jgi:starch-binding outer membrane protein, SusD/RagB family
MNKRILFLFILLMCVSFSCSDNFIEVQPKGVLSAQSLQNKAGVNFLLIGAYSALDGWTTEGGAFRSYQASADNYVFGGIASDDAYKGTTAGDQPAQSFIEAYESLPDNVYFQGKWRLCYDGIARSNDALQALAKATDVTDLERQYYTAEARFIRGHFHFELKKMFNWVPYIDDVTYNPSDLQSTKVKNDKDIWPDINADFLFAYNNLPDNQTQKGRPSKWAAAAMLGKAYLFQEDWNNAKIYLDAVVASNKYSLMPLYHDNFRAATNNNAESVFEVQYSVNDGASGGENGNIGATLNYPYGGGGVTTCCGFYQPSQNLVNVFKTDANGLPIFDTFNDAFSEITSDQGLATTAPFTPYAGTVDPRLDWTVGRRGIPFLDWGVHPGQSYVRDQAYGGPYSPKKHVMYRSDVGVNTFSGNPRLNANNYRMIRYANVLLWLAEVEVRLGNLDVARGLVNQVRQRAANPAGFVKTSAGANAANYVIGLYTTSWTDPVYALKAVQYEERLELGMEGHRFFDLVRWKIAAKTLNDYIAGEKSKRTYMAGKVFVAGKHEYYPIPLQEILNSQIKGEFTLKQNDGY